MHAHACAMGMMGWEFRDGNSNREFHPCIVIMGIPFGNSVPSPGSKWMGIPFGNSVPCFNACGNDHSTVAVGVEGKGGIGMRGRSGRVCPQGAGAFALYPCICPLPLGLDCVES